MPVGTRSIDAVCSICTEVIGQIEDASFSMRNGYSFVPCVVPVFHHANAPRRDLITTRWSAR